MTAKRPPTIGVTCITARPENPYRPPRQGQNQTYIDALLRAGGLPLLIPDLSDRTLLRAAYDLVDGLLLPGGEDVDPAHYGQAPMEQCGTPSPRRDQTELALARWATEEGKPLLAICRGIQVLNVALGGSLYQDIAAQLPHAGRHDWYPDHRRDLLAHTVTCRAGTRLAEILGTGPVKVNSLHHQAVRDVAPGLQASAFTPDGLVEGLEAADHPYAVGVQWHPEELAAVDARAQALFDALVSASRREA